jgi:hypothetical protein
MIDKAILYSNAIRNSMMWRGESAVAYNSFYMPSLVYGVPATTLTKEECEDIQRPVVNVILPKMGIVRSAPRKVVFGTKQHGGLGLTHLADLQGNIRLQYLLGHLRCGDTTGELMKMLLEYTQLECGCRGNPLQHEYKKYEGLMGSLFNMQGHSRNKRLMGTKGEQKERSHNYGTLSSIRKILR